MWRPSHTCFTKWSNPYHLDCHTRAGHTKECIAFEAGADAILEALKEQGLEFTNQSRLVYALAPDKDDVDFWTFHPHIFDPKLKIEGSGWLVFIPEESK